MHTRRLIPGALALALLASIPAPAATFKIEIDYMVAAGHSHMPSQAVIDAVVQMFACRGHTLIIDVDDALPHYNVLRRNPNNCNSSLFNYNGEAASFGSLRDTYFDRINDPTWNYCIFAHNYEDPNCNTTGSSGLGELPGRYFVVTLGSFSGQTGTLFDQAATLAHEFGHNLGLTHCGESNCDADGNYNPILPSIMSYRYQLAGVRTNVLCNGLAPPQAIFKDIDYSEGRQCTVNELALNEFNGTFMQPVDWDCDGTLESSVIQDIGGDGDGWCGDATGLSVLQDRDEWAAVALYTTLRDRGKLPEPNEVSCITAEEWDLVQREILDRGSCPQPTLQTEICPSGRNVFVSPGTGLGVGWCTLTFKGVQTAQASSTHGSVYFLRPGDYNESGVTTLNKNGIWMCNTGTAVIR